jgi:hypothetical protein
MTNKLCYSGKKYNLEWGNYYYSMLLFETKDVSPDDVSPDVSPERDEQKRLNNGGDRKNEKSTSKNRVDKRNPTCKQPNLQEISHLHFPIPFTAGTGHRPS